MRSEDPPFVPHITIVPPTTMHPAFIEENKQVERAAHRRERVIPQKGQCVIA